LLYPGQDDGHADEQITHPVDLSQAITAVADDNTGLQSMEMVVFPLNGRLETCLAPRTTDKQAIATRQGRHVADGQLKLDQVSTTDIEPKQYDTERNQRAISHLKNTLNELPTAVVPDSIGYEARRLSFAGLGPPVRTDRLAVGDSPSYPVVEDLQFVPDDELFTHLLNEATPFIFQVIVGFDSGKHYDYTLTARLAVFKEGYGISSVADWVESAQRDSRHTLSDYYAHPNLKSSLDVDLKKYFTIDLDATGQEVLSRREYTPIEQAQAARKLARGRDEFSLLFHRAHNAATAYEELGYNAKLPIKKDLLPLFFTGYHVEYDYPLWDGTRTWQSPTFGDGSLLEPAPGTTSDLSGTVTTARPSPESADGNTAEQSADSRSSEEPTTVELDDHADLAVRAAKRLLSGGWDVTILDTDIVAELREANILTEYLGDADGSVPDIKATDSNKSRTVESSTAGSTKPANVLINAMRAEYNDEELIFFADNGACHRKPPKGGRRVWKLCPAVPTPCKT